MQPHLPGVVHRVNFAVGVGATNLLVVHSRKPRPQTGTSGRALSCLPLWQRRRLLESLPPQSNLSNFIYNSIIEPATAMFSLLACSWGQRLPCLQST